jgi:cell volume regulation protein A
MADRHLILTANALFARGLMAWFLAGRLRVPSLVLFLGIGMLVGTDALGLAARRRLLRFSLPGSE